MFENNKIFFLSVSSGSSGNCSYIGNHESGFLIDAGIPYGLIKRSKSSNKKNLKEALIENGISIHGIKGLLISHCHSDHIRYAADYSSNKDLNIPVFISENTYLMYEYIRARYKKNLYKPLEDVHFFEPEISFKIHNFEVFAIPVDHDAFIFGNNNIKIGQTFAFIIKADNYTISHITDLGKVSDNLIDHSLNSRLLHLEFNYDPEMLINGKYPYSLKKRIRSKYGHLSNIDAVSFIMKYHIDTAEHLSIAHISKENNSYDKICESLEQISNNSNMQFHKTFHGNYSEKIYI